MAFFGYFYMEKLFLWFIHYLENEMKMFCLHFSSILQALKLSEVNEECSREICTHRIAMYKPMFIPVSCHLCAPLFWESNFLTALSSLVFKCSS